MIWCSYLLPSGVVFFFFFLLKPALVQLSAERGRKHIPVLQHLQWVWHSVTLTKPKWWDAAETCANGALCKWTAGSFPLFSTQHNTLSSCHDDTRTFTMQHRFQMSEQTDRNTAWLFLAFAHKQYIPPSFNYLMNTGGNSSLSEVWKRFWGFKKKINKSNWTAA